VALQVKSTDVIHEAEVPELDLRFDAIPGRTSEVETETFKIGVFLEQTSILSGQGYEGMNFTISVVSRKDYDAWRNHFLKQSGCVDVK
jgi:heme/copper-type cytochrome/quinol oxidase subunit 2